ncbi:MAG: hypothetical protein H9W80_10560 [Enterococcus sp.]|nr:hypothetical protein [Enterococcus sp.]
MKIFPWLDDWTSVVGIKYALGNGAEVLDKLEDAGWVIDAEENCDILDEIAQYVYLAEGLLLPEPENPADPHAVAVYLKFKAVKKSMRPHRMAVRIGYLPRESNLKKQIKRATIVKIRCQDTYHSMDAEHDFCASVVNAPLKLTSKEYKDNAIDLDLK